MRADGRNISPAMTGPELLKARPAALGFLEERGIDPWLDPHAPLGSLAAAKRIPWPAFAAGLEALPEGGGEGHAHATLAGLLDRLVAEHRVIRERLLPAIAAGLEDPSGIGGGGPPGPRMAWKAFTAGLEAHMREEEAFLFPRLLEYDYSLRHRGHHPDFAGGSVNVYIAIRLLGNEHLQMEGLRRFLAGPDRPSAGQATLSPRQERIAHLLEGFHTFLEAHNRLEEGSLFPKARDLEKALYDAAIAGDAVAAGKRLS